MEQHLDRERFLSEIFDIEYIIDDIADETDSTFIFKEKETEEYKTKIVYDTPGGTHLVIL